MWIDSFVPADLSRAPLDFEWREPDDHIGPVETETPLMTKFYGKTSCAGFCLAAGIAAWGAKRLEAAVDIRDLVDLIEAVFPYMADPQCLDLSPVLDEPVPNRPKPTSALLELRWLLMGCVLPARWVDDVNQPEAELFHLAFLVRHLLDDQSRARFDAWLDSVVARLDRLAPRPDERPEGWVDGSSEEEALDYVRLFWGQPLPWQVLERDVSTEEAGPLLKKMLSEFDWSRNRYVTRAPTAAHGP